MEARRDRDVSQIIAGIERQVADAGDAGGNRVATTGFGRRVFDEPSLALVGKDSTRTATDGLQRIHRYHGQAVAVIERTVAYARDTVAYRDVGQAGAVRERPVPDARRC